MTNMTALQQLIQWMEESSKVIPFDQESCYNKAIELLEVEKQQIIDAVGAPIIGEQYYNETYKK